MWSLSDWCQAFASVNKNKQEVYILSLYSENTRAWSQRPAAGTNPHPSTTGRLCLGLTMYSRA